MPTEITMESLQKQIASQEAVIVSIRNQFTNLAGQFLNAGVQIDLLTAERNALQAQIAALSPSCSQPSTPTSAATP